MHGVVNHSIEFLNNDEPEINMQKIERLCKSLKNQLKREGRAGDNDDMYIFQFMYLHQQRNHSNTTPQQIFPLFFRDIANVYYGYGKVGLKPVAYSSNRKIEVCDDCEEQFTLKLR